MKTTGFALPEFDVVRHEDVTSPEFRPGNDFIVGKLSRKLLILLLESFLVLDWAALVRRPCAELRPTRSNLEVLVRLCRWHSFNSTLDTD